MKTVLLCFTLVLVVFIALNRERLYLRDPLATVYRNGAEESDWVFINFSNDVLVQAKESPHAPKFLVQSWNSFPGIPPELFCILGMACLSPSDHVPMQGWNGARTAAMSSREVSFLDGDNTNVRVTLR